MRVWVCMNTWTPLWSGIVDSSLWEEDGDVVKVFMTMLATKDSDHICRLDAYKIHKKCNIDELKVVDILKILASPDKRRKVPQEFEGRRIKMVEDGWLVLNGEKYRKMVSDEMRKARLRKAQTTYREKQRLARGTPLKGEEAAVKALNNGDQAKFDRIASGEFRETPPEYGKTLTTNGGEIRNLVSDNHLTASKK